MTNIGNMYGPDFTFLGIPRCDLDKPESYKDADVIIVGAPIDSGTSHRSGAKMGPQAIRMGDYLPHDASRPHLAMRIDPLQKLKIYDAGDLLMPGGDLIKSLKVLEVATEKISKAGAIAVVLGGDHSIASADVTGIANHLGKGKVSMIHFDAHADTGENQFGALIGHGTPMRRLIESGAVRGDRFLQLGLRGYWPDDATLKWMAGKGMKSYEMTEIHHRGMKAVLDESFAIPATSADAIEWSPPNTTAIAPAFEIFSVATSKTLSELTKSPPDINKSPASKIFSFCSGSIRIARCGREASWGR